VVDRPAQRAAHARAVARAVRAAAARIGGDGRARGRVAGCPCGRGAADGQDGEEEWCRARHACCVVEGCGVGMAS